jgi:hypothetical protein
MTIKVKAEKKEKHIGVLVTPTMLGQLRDFADEQGCNTSEAVRYIVSLFFADRLLKKQANSQKVKGLEHRKIAKKQVETVES